MTNHQLAKLLLAQPEQRIVVQDWNGEYAYDVLQVKTTGTLSLIVQDEDTEHGLD